MPRYSLRTLLILLAAGPPVLAPLLALVWERPLLMLTLVVISAFAVLWLSCGVTCLFIMRAAEWLFDARSRAMGQDAEEFGLGMFPAARRQDREASTQRLSGPRQVLIAGIW